MWHATQRESGETDVVGSPSAGRWSIHLTRAIAAAAMVVAAVLGVSLARAAHHSDQLQSALAAKGGSAAVSAALETPGHRLVALRSPEGAQLATFVLLPDGNGYLVSLKVGALPGDETYQLWGIIDNQPISLALLGNQPRHAGFTVASATPSSLAITVEPAGGVAVPDSAAVASGAVSRV